MKPKPRKHTAEQFPLLPTESKGKLRVSFDLAPEDGDRFRKVVASYPPELGVSESQVAKMLLRLGLRAWEEGRP